MSQNVIISSGDICNMLTVIEFAYTKRKRRYYKCLCSCGNYTVVSASRLKAKHTKSCGCERSNQSRINIELNRPKTYLGDGIAPARSAYRQYVKHAQEKFRDFALSFDVWYTMTQQPCHYCGSIKTNTAYGKTKNNIFTYNGIDRVDNLQGYTISNCVPCCIICNRAKRELSYNEFIQWISKIKEHNK